jgi:hypothetical protein
LKRLRPRLDARQFYEPLQVRGEIPTGVTRVDDDRGILFDRPASVKCGECEGVFKIRSKLREDRNEAYACLRRVNAEAIGGPVYVSLRQDHKF